MSDNPTAIISFYDGTLFDLLAPDPALITIDAIATGLANTCRYGGQMPKGGFLSVAAHSLHVHDLVRGKLYPWEHAARFEPTVGTLDIELAALLHDASEGLGMGDVVKPLKRHIGNYENIEANIQAAVAQAFLFDAGLFDLAVVVDADRQAFYDEMVGCRDWSLAKLRDLCKDQSIQIGAYRYGQMSRKGARKAFKTRLQDVLIRRLKLQAPAPGTQLHAADVVRLFGTPRK